MNNLGTSRTEKNTEETNKTVSLSWIDNPEVQELLDVVISIIAEEYIEIARQNPDIFSNRRQRTLYRRRAINLFDHIKQKSPDY